MESNHTTLLVRVDTEVLWKSVLKHLDLLVGSGREWTLTMKSLNTNQTRKAIKT